MRKRVLEPQKTRGMGKRLAIYSALGSACGMTFGATAAEADIIFTDFQGVASQGSPLNIDVDDDGVTDFTFRLTVAGPNIYSSYSNWAAVRGADANAFVSTFPAPYTVPGFSYGPANLAFGDSIVGRDFHGGEGPMQMAYTQSFPDTFWGPFGGENFPGSSQTGYIGLQFLSGEGDTVFGWVKASVVGDVTNVNFPGAEIHIDGFAYATAGEAITAGQVPEPTTGTLSAIGLLALGAAGVAERRRRKKQVVDQA